MEAQDIVFAIQEEMKELQGQLKTIQETVNQGDQRVMGMQEEYKKEREASKEEIPALIKEETSKMDNLMKQRIEKVEEKFVGLMNIIYPKVNQVQAATEQIPQDIRGDMERMFDNFGSGVQVELDQSMGAVRKQIEEVTAMVVDMQEEWNDPTNQTPDLSMLEGQIVHVKDGVAEPVILQDDQEIDNVGQVWNIVTRGRKGKKGGQQGLAPAQQSQQNARQPGRNEQRQTQNDERKNTQNERQIIKKRDAGQSSKQTYKEALTDGNKKVVQAGQGGQTGNDKNVTQMNPGLRKKRIAEDQNHPGMPYGRQLRRLQDGGDARAREG